MTDYLPKFDSTMNFDTQNTLVLSSPSLCGAVHQTRTAGYQFPSHLHTTVEIYLITSGRCRMNISGKEICCKANDFVMILPNTVHSFFLDHDSECKFQHIHFHPELFSHFIISEGDGFSISLTDSLLFHCKFFYKKNADCQLTYMVNTIVSSFGANDASFSTVSANLLLSQIMLYVLESVTRENPPGSTLRTQNGYIAFTLQYISMHYNEKILIEDISGKLNISSRYLGKIFSEHMNLSLANYINIYRINQAIELMTSTDNSLIDIALAIGLKDSQHFSKLFYKIIGITPHKYRKMIECQDKFFGLQ
ncbi:AraC family transcriptional regulator [Lachnoclostridium sp. An181]|uniref:AraC family transcriptional regulator n=1 Tax=Lachnoclostridium sp. An181 TaxID=1965575 RepID=UPI000B387F58|nr:AraC family transcriptional regulator [Lachnoclostridium sp. An181]OUP49355.1 hypothetical protein B5F18_08105 [Lachnoclostridium sp. An181]